MTFPNGGRVEIGTHIAPYGFIFYTTSGTCSVNVGWVFDNYSGMTLTVTGPAGHSRTVADGGNINFESEVTERVH